MMMVMAFMVMMMLVIMVMIVVVFMLLMTVMMVMLFMIVVMIVVMMMLMLSMVVVVMTVLMLVVHLHHFPHQFGLQIARTLYGLQNILAVQRIPWRRNNRCLLVMLPNQFHAGSQFFLAELVRPAR